MLKIAETTTPEQINVEKTQATQVPQQTMSFRGYNVDNVPAQDEYVSSEKKDNTAAWVAGGLTAAAAILGAVVFKKGGAEGIEKKFGERMKDGWNKLFKTGLITDIEKAGFNEKEAVEIKRAINEALEGDNGAKTADELAAKVKEKLGADYNAKAEKIDEFLKNNEKVKKRLPAPKEGETPKTEDGKEPKTEDSKEPKTEDGKEPKTEDGKGT